MRIAVGRFSDAIVVAGEGLSATLDDGSALAVEGRVVIAAGAGLRVNSKRVDGDVVHVRAPGTLSLRGHRYRRELEIRFRTYDKRPELLVVHPLDLEDYVTGIVSSELPGGWPLEAYKAQAVAARTFAVWQKYRRLDLPYQLESTVLDQVYAGVEREHALAQQAADETRGVVLTSRRHVAQAYFHASCGDRTESALEGWGTALPYLPGSACGFCKAAPRYTWTTRIARADVDKAFGMHVTALAVGKRSHTGRARTVVVNAGARTITGADLRRLLGYNTVWSTWIDALELQPDALLVRGRGSGHGVGMCQWGARGMAVAGRRYDEILGAYYPGAALARLY